MEEKVISLNEGNLHMLRNKVEKKLSHSDMRRKLIGGISEEDVSIYVDSMRQQFRLVEDELRQQFRELQQSKDELRKEYEAYRQRSGEEKAGMQEALENALVEASRFKDECSEKDGMIQKINERFDSEVGRLTDAGSQLESERDELKKQLLSYERETKAEGTLALKVKELEEQLLESQKTAEEYQKSMREMERQVSEEHMNLARAQEDKTNLNSRVASFKSEIDAIYKQLGSLNEQVSANESLQQELELERLRAEKAEQDMSQFRELMSGLKDKFHKDQIQLDVQFNEMEEKQKAMQDDINGLRENLEDFCKATGTEIDDLFATLENK